MLASTGWAFAVAIGAEAWTSPATAELGFVWCLRAGFFAGFFSGTACATGCGAGAAAGAGAGAGRRAPVRRRAPEPAREPEPAWAPEPALVRGVGVGVGAGVGVSGTHVPGFVDGLVLTLRTGARRGDRGLDHRPGTGQGRDRGGEDGEAAHGRAGDAVGGHAVCSLGVDGDHAEEHLWGERDGRQY